MRIWILAGTLLLLGLGQGVRAQQEPLMVEAQLDSVVITAHFEPTPLSKAVQPVRVLSAGRIGLQAASHLQALLYQVPWLALRQHRVLGGAPELQGLGPQHVAILVDGVPVLGRIDGRLDLAQLPLTNVARVEIVEGPSSVFYGSHALGGVINLITRGGGQLPEGPSLRFRSYLESAGSWDNSLDLRYRRGAFWAGLQLGRHAFDEVAGGAGGARAADWPERRQRFLLPMLGWTGRWGRLTYTAHLFDEVLTERGEPDAEGVARDTEYRSRRTRHTLAYTRRWAGRYLQLTANWSRYDRKIIPFLVQTQRGSRIRQTAAIDTTVYRQGFLRGHYLHHLGTTGLQLFAGGEVWVEQIEGARIASGSRRLGTYALFGGLLYRLGPLHLRPAFRYSFNDEGQALLTPALNVRLDRGATHTWRVTLAQGFRAPSLKERYLKYWMTLGPNTYHITGTPQLRPEVSWHASLRYEHRRRLGTGQGVLEVAAFLNNVRDLIALSPLVRDAQGIWTRHYENIRRYRTRGVELTVRLQAAGMGLWATVTPLWRYVELSETYPDAPSYASVIDVLGGGEAMLPGSLQVLVLYRYGGRQTIYYTVRDRATGQTALRQARVPDYHLVDLTLQRAFWQQRLWISVGVKNLFDVTNLGRTVWDVRRAHQRNLFLYGRTFFLQLRVGWER
ncbi:TonB-dependent receptor plug domain-containing protein [Rhodothermus profundi]|uniref:Outer membrane receptor for ferrienterochelin and colicins n=1 Tax=Rhodothermus profundi TaxID=633813 RepID=A0A1M6UFY3_9BACT|nr:TonB-dependent receptor [Rhodothermus profundi]SHK68053.1 outer membrane receptor for ferrienterochelin and colicins [Rhodothermus profundi]